MRMVSSSSHLDKDEKDLDDDLGTGVEELIALRGERAI